MYIPTPSTRVKAQERGSALLVVLLVALVALASIVGLATFRKSAIPSSPASYQAQIVSSTPTPTPSPIAYVQSTSTALNGQKASVSSTYPSIQTQGNLNVVIIGWQGGGNSVATVTDTLGNTYTPILQNHGTGISQAMYYAKNIQGGSNNIVKATFASNAASPDLIVLEYRNADTLNPLNATHAQSGTGTLTPSSGQAPNITAGELLIGAGMTNKLFTAPGTSYTQRALTAKAKNIAEDRIVTSAGSYDASATLSDSTGSYVMQIASFKPAPAPSAMPTPTPTPAPTPTPTPTSTPTYTYSQSSYYAYSQSSYYAYSQSSYYAYSQSAYVTPTPTPTPAPATNIAPQGTAYRWHTNTTSTADTNKVAASGLNDTNLSTDVNLSGGGGESSTVYEAGGVTWSTAQSIDTVKFIQGTWEATDDGGFGANLTLQTTQDGTTWVSSAWTVSPAYAYNSNTVAGVTYTFTGSAVSVKGIRISGQVHTNTTPSSWWENMREVQAYTSGGSYTYSQSSYYAYSQSSYYTYSQSTYTSYTYSQSSYYAYSQSAYVSSASCHAVGPTATGNGSGSGWNNRMNKLPATLVRGDIYYLMDGNYGSYAFTTLNSGTIRIVVKKAQSYDFGRTSDGCSNDISAGWDAATMGGSQAVFGQITSSGGQGYYTLDGNGRTIIAGCGVSPAVNAAASDCGIKLTAPAFPSGTYGVLWLNGTYDNGVTRAYGWTVRYIEMVGGGDAANSIPGLNEHTFFCRNGCNNLLFEHNYVHHSACDFIDTPYGDGETFNLNHFNQNISSANCHAQFFLGDGNQMNNVTFSNNLIQEVQGTSYWSVLNGGQASNWNIFNNVIFQSPTSTRPGISTGIFACINTGSHCTNIKMIGNSFVNAKTDYANHYTLADDTGSATDNITFQNNLLYGITGGGNPIGGSSFPIITHDHNSFLNSGPVSGLNGGTGDVTVTSGAPIPFVNWPASNFHLISENADWTGGITLLAPFNVDADGKTHGADGTWERGAYEF